MEAANKDDKLFSEEIEYHTQIRDIFFNRAFSAIASLGLSVGCLVPVFNPALPDNAKLSLHLYGVLSGVAAAITFKRMTGDEKKLNALQLAAKEVEKQRLRNQAELVETEDQLRHQRLLEHINEIFYPKKKEVVKEEVFTPGYTGRTQTTIEDVNDDLIPDIDYSWMDDKFIMASKAVYGAKGSGKSTFLAHEAIEFLRLNPDGELRIVDLHYDDEESRWLPGVPQDELLKQYVANKPEQGLALFRRVRAVGRERIEKQLRGNKSPKLKLICDEFVGFMLRLTDEEKSEVLEIIQEVQFEFRKFNVDVTLGLHSVKKGISGIDSEVLANMDILILGKALADPNTVLPVDFEKKELLKQQNAMQMTLRKGLGYACVVRKLGDNPGIEVIPEIKLPSSVSVENHSQFPTDAIQAMKEWVNSLPTPPDKDEVKAAFETFTGQILTEEALKYLMNDVLGIK